MDSWLIYMMLAASIGGTLTGIMGWAKQKPPVPFNWRDFIITLGDSLIAGAVYSITLATHTEDMTKDLITAAVFGAGGDMVIRGVVGTAVNKVNKPTE